MNQTEVSNSSSFNLNFNSELVSFEENKPEIKNDHLTRYVVSVLMPVDFRQRTAGNGAIADFNRKTDSQLGGRMNIGNLDFYPPMRLMPLGGVKTEIPFEIPARRVSGGSPETDSAPFDPVLAKSVDGIKFLTKSARQCLDTFLLNYEDKGGIDFPLLTGMENQVAEKLFKIVYPAEKLPIAVTQRIKLGMTFTGPFLDEIRHYFDYVAEERIQIAIKQLELKSHTVDLLNHIKERIVIAVSQAWSFANTTLNETESSITKKEKPGYDRPEYRFSSNPPPLDIYLLAHTNRNPIDMKQLEAAKEMTRGMNEPMVDVLEKISDKLTAQGGVTLSDLQTLLNSNNEEWQRKFSEQEARFKEMLAKRETAKEPEMPAEPPPKTKKSS